MNKTLKQSRTYIGTDDFGDYYYKEDAIIRTKSNLKRACRALCKNCGCEEHMIKAINKEFGGFEG